MNFFTSVGSPWHMSWDRFDPMYSFWHLGHHTTHKLREILPNSCLFPCQQRLDHCPTLPPVTRMARTNTCMGTHQCWSCTIACAHVLSLAWRAVNFTNLLAPMVSCQNVSLPPSSTTKHCANACFLFTRWPLSELEWSPRTTLAPFWHSSRSALICHENHKNYDIFSCCTLVLGAYCNCTVYPSPSDW